MKINLVCALALALPMAACGSVDLDDDKPELGEPPILWADPSDEADPPDAAPTTPDAAIDAAVDAAIDAPVDPDAAPVVDAAPAPDADAAADASVDAAIGCDGAMAIAPS